MIRLFDFVVALIGLLILLPVFIVLSLVIMIDAGRPVFYMQQRIGRHGVPFALLKFRTMRRNAAADGALTIGSRDPRITPSGYFLRRSKIDELPQLINVLKGDMSFVGPRPEMEKYVALYNAEQRRVLEVRPGITDLASLEYIRENDLLGKSADPEKTYVEEIMPDKLRINLEYLSARTVWTDLHVILKTVARIVGLS